MYIDVIMIFLFIVATGVWAEYRAIRGRRKGYQEGLEQAVQNTMQAVAADKMFPVPLAVALVYKALLDKGLITIVQEDGKDIVLGLRGSRATAEELSLFNIKDQFFRDLYVEMSKNRWIKPS